MEGHHNKDCLPHIPSVTLTSVLRWSSNWRLITEDQHFHTSRWTRPRHVQSVNILETFLNAYQFRIYKSAICSYNFHIFRFLGFGKGEIDGYRFMSKHKSAFATTISTYFDCPNLVKGRLMCIVLYPNRVTPRHRCVTMHEVDTHQDRF